MHKISYPERQSAKKIREIKLQIILLFLSVCGISSSAQIEPALCNLPKGLEVSYIDVRDQSIRIYFDYTMPDDSAWLQSMKGLSVSRNAYLSVEGEPVRPRLISAINIPVDCEAVRAAMVSDKPSQRHRFILEFEKLPDGCRAFDLIGDEGGFGAINIKNVPMNRADSVEVPAIRSYLSGYPLKEYGRYYSDGVLVSYVKCNGIIVNSVADIVSAYGKYINVQIYVQNLRDEPILLKPDNISAKALCASDTKTKNSDRMSEKAQSPDAEASTRRPVDVEILSCQEYDKIVGKKQRREQFWFSV
ncbi:MAG: hypothetical protein K2F63_02215, partial [Muribaculaceae bacterium]|nr:hypothetical protein [Muribaculaceae bacterium]